MAEAIMFWAIPAFFLLIGIELVAARVMGRAVYRANDAIASLSLGVMSQVAGVFTKALTIGIYAVAVEHVALFELSATSPWVWIAGLVLYDFCYYWLHRAGHEVNLLWAAHVVHHQSERYNLTTALRQTSSGALFGWVFYLPMAVLGFPLEVFAVVAVIDLLYQFWIHTELVPKLGWFDRVFASPSNHRAHHAVNERYLDRTTAACSSCGIGCLALSSRRTIPIPWSTARARRCAASIRSGPTSRCTPPSGATPGGRPDGATGCGSGSASRVGVLPTWCISIRSRPSTLAGPNSIRRRRAH
ncbi:sterol desaturase family protein [Silanimonas sp.]|uniref:sterol desaturase family protein n=1 Tax=Silanimonas sp. TaxID=1929290 RepID=UPI0031BAAFD8